ncbi:MAG TPA: sigma 54-interacting transcriptional regulator, partial [Vicinamibacterales bacterium]|nr:sigma 54-interacting transcriptional regulator [Vicinamibacterales bacterium]
AAHGGTLFLDEVGDLPLDAQPALLRVLQEKQVTPVGATTPVAVDLRVISATHRSLEALSAQGHFRDDLRARLSGYQLALPALVERREDLGLLVSALVTRLAPARAAEFTEKFPGRCVFTAKKMGAQTAEANINAGLAAARQIVGFFERGDATFRVN